MTTIEWCIPLTWPKKYSGLACALGTNNSFKADGSAAA
jgi:hypothetical protein